MKISNQSNSLSPYLYIKFLFEKYNFSLPVFILLITINISTVAAQNILSFKVDPAYAYGGSASDIFKEIKYTPLQTTNESLFGRIDQMEVTDKYFIILDKSQSTILVFNKNGTFHAKIRPRGKIEWIANFTINRISNEIMFQGNQENKFFVFDYDCKLLRQDDCPQDIATFFCFHKDRFVYNISRPTKNVEPDGINFFDMAYSDRNGKIIKQFLPYNPQVAPYDYNEMFPFYGSKNSSVAMFSIPYEYTVYELVDSGIVNQYNFIFPLKSSLPLNFSNDPAYYGKRTKFHLSPENKNIFIMLKDLYKTRNYLTFLTYHEGAQTIDDVCAVNLKTGNLISFGKVNPDSSSYFLPVLDPRAAERIHAVYNETFYTSIPSFILLNYKQNSKKIIEYSSELKNFFKMGSRINNPVVIQFRMKENI